MEHCEEGESFQMRSERAAVARLCRPLEALLSSSACVLSGLESHWRVAIKEVIDAICILKRSFWWRMVCSKVSVETARPIYEAIAVIQVRNDGDLEFVNGTGDREELCGRTHSSG